MPKSLNSVLGDIANYANQGSQIYNNVTGNNKPNTTAPVVNVTTPAADSGIGKFLPWIIGGLVVIGALFMFSRK